MIADTEAAYDVALDNERRGALNRLDADLAVLESAAEVLRTLGADARAMLHLLREHIVATYRVALAHGAGAPDYVAWNRLARAADAFLAHLPRDMRAAAPGRRLELLAADADG
jgi:hypothetical protein